jgi:exodeoxyribonuclease V alpha subunit
MSLFLTTTAQRLAPFIEAGVFDADTIAFTDELLRLVAAVDAPDPVLLGAALAVRAPGQGHVCVDLRRVAEHVAVDDATRLPWPDAAGWQLQLAGATALVTVPEVLAAAGADATQPGDAVATPLVLDGPRLYLTRLWLDERSVAAQLQARSDGRLRVVTGGPGSGKTTLIARELLERLRERPALRVLLAAPTGKAAARMREAMTEALARAQASDEEVARMAAVPSSTLHKLLGLRPGQLDAVDAPTPAPLEADLVIVDEVSMVSLPLLARLLRTLAADTPLWLVGDPGQLASVEAGCVLADIVHAPAAGEGGCLHAVMRHLRSQYRFGPDSGIGQLAAALREGDADAALTVLAAGSDDVRWVDPDGPQGAQKLEALRADIAAHARRVADKAARGEAAEALDELLALRTLCAHREGPWGVGEWNRQVERALGVRGADQWYLGRPLLVTRNDRQLDLMNGELGLVLRSDGGVRALFPGRDGGLRQIPTVRLSAVETVHAMTIHKSQGSEFEHVVVVLPPAGSRLLTRELLYTAVTRARSRVTLVGSADALRSGVARTAARASGLADRLTN